MNFDRILATEKKHPGKNKKTHVIEHHTGNSNYELMCQYLSGKKTNEKSCHYVVALDGRICKIGTHNDILWHAGISKYNGLSDFNRLAIGIEICSDGHTYSEEQKRAVYELTKEIITQEKIPPENILRHADISGFRGRWDVGPNFFAPLTWQQYQDSFREQAPSPWAKESWNKALLKGIVTKDPQGELDNVAQEIIWQRLGQVTQLQGRMSRERFIYILSKLGLI